MDGCTAKWSARWLDDRINLVDKSHRINTHILKVSSLIQVRKELEVCGIEFYPQKEFDEDQEDKADNDKIRVQCKLIDTALMFLLPTFFFASFLLFLPYLLSSIAPLIL